MVESSALPRADWIVEPRILIKVEGMVEPCVLLGTDDVRLNGNGFVIELKALASVVGENDVIVLLMPGEEEREVKMVDGGIYM